MVREVTLAVQSVPYRAHLPGPGPSARSRTLCQWRRGSPRTPQAVLGPAAGPLPLHPPGVAADPAAGVLATHSPAAIGSEAGPILNQSVKELHWRPALARGPSIPENGVSQGTCCSKTLMFPYTQNLPVCEAPAGNSGTQHSPVPKSATSDPSMMICIQHRPHFHRLILQKSHSATGLPYKIRSINWNSSQPRHTWSKTSQPHSPF